MDGTAFMWLCIPDQLTSCVPQMHLDRSAVNHNVNHAVLKDSRDVILKWRRRFRPQSFAEFRKVSQGPMPHLRQPIAFARNEEACLAA